MGDLNKEKQKFQVLHEFLSNLFSSFIIEIIDFIHKTSIGNIIISLYFKLNCFFIIVMINIISNITMYSNSLFVVLNKNRSQIMFLDIVKNILINFKYDFLEFIDFKNGITLNIMLIIRNKIRI